MKSKRNLRKTVVSKNLVLRKLQFDSLEERRLLAGLNVFVFNDTDASQIWESTREQGISDRVVFLDSNQNGLIDTGERWVKTDDRGLAAFKNLSPGTYFPAVLENHSLLQTTHVIPAPSGQILDAGHESRIVEWNSETRSWLIRDGKFELFDWSALQSVRTFTVAGTITDAAVIESIGKAALLSRDSLGNHTLVILDLESGVTHVLEDRAAGNPAQVMRVDRQFLVAFAKNNEYTLRRVDFTLGLDPSNAFPTLASVQNAPTFTSAKFAGAKNGSYLLVEQVKATGSQFQFWTVDRTRLVNMRLRFVAGEIEDWKLSSDGLHFAVAVKNGGVRFFRASSTTTQQTGWIGDAAGPIGFDSARNQWLTGVRGVENLLKAYRVKDASLAYSLEAKVDGVGPISLARRQILTDPFSTKIYAAGANGTYAHNIIVPRAARVELTNPQETKRVEIGQRIVSSNVAPAMESFLLGGLEDIPVPVPQFKLKEHSTDSDDEVLHYFVTSPPSNGTISWSPSQGGVYLPNRDFFGLDSIVVQAYDGRDWATPKTIHIDIAPVNDPPGDILIPPISIGEHILPGQDIGVITVVDPDPGSVYEITVNDPRIFVVGTILRIAPDARFDYESESSIVLEVSAKNVDVPEDKITRTITITVEDENDAPTDFTLRNHTVPENVAGAVIGSLEVEDPDANDMFSWVVSDGRFTVENNVLKLAERQSLNFEAQSQIELLLTVTDKGNGRVAKRVTIDVENRNDLPTAILLEKTLVVERVRGYRIGTIAVQDEDVGETYSYSFSDNRFTVADQILRLKSGVFVSYKDEPEIPLIITATSNSTGAQITRAVVLQVLENTNPYQNNGLPVDVDGDNRVTPRDVLRIINELNSRGIRPLTGAPDYDDGAPGGDWFDVNGDGSITPLDAVIVINYLNRNGMGSGGNGGGTGEGNGGGEGEGRDGSNPPPSGLKNSRSSRILGADVYNRSLEAYLAELQREQLKKQRAR